MEVSLDSYEKKPSRRIARNVALLLAALAGLAALAINLWVWLGIELPPRAAIPKLEAQPLFPEPRVLHDSALALPNVRATVPYQAGHYEIAQVLPVELTVIYRLPESGVDARLKGWKAGRPEGQADQPTFQTSRLPDFQPPSSNEARVVLFTHPLRDRWQMLTPYPGAGLFDDGWSAARLEAVLQVRKRPSLIARLLPWRLLRWVGLRQAQAIVLRGDLGATREAPALQRWWTRKHREGVTIGREYKPGQGSVQRVAATTFFPGQAVDLRFSFSAPQEDNAALIRAWLDGLAPLGGKKPDNQAGLSTCESLPAAAPDQLEIRICRELYQVALWLSQQLELNAAAQLVDTYAQAQDREGLRVLRDQLNLRRSEDAQARRLLERIDGYLQAWALGSGL